MRFGHDFHKHMIPEYHRHYVDYNLLKRLAKSPGLQVYDELNSSLVSLDSFLAQRIQILDIAYSELCDLFGLDVGHIGRAKIPDPTNICPFELTLLLEAFHEFQQEWKKIHWFVRVNTDAVERILNKLCRLQRADNPSYIDIRLRWHPFRTHWDQETSGGLGMLSSMIADAKHGLDPMWRRPGKSLYLARAFDTHPWSKPFTDEVIQAAQSGDFNFVIEALASKSPMPKVSERELQNLTSDLLRFSVMLRPQQVKAFLHLLPSPEHFLIEHEVVKWAIVAMGRRKKADSGREAIPHRQHHAPIVVQPLRDILEACTQRLSEVLMAEDGCGRLPAHYAAMYDVPGEGFCEMFVPYETDSHGTAIPAARHEPDGSQHLDQAPGSQVLESTDIEGLTPLHMAVMANRPRTVADVERNILVEYECRGLSYYGAELPKIVGGLIPIALMNQTEDENDLFTHLLELTGLYSGWAAALPVAVQVGYTKATSLLFRDPILGDFYNPDTQDPDDIEYEPADGRGWTILFHACALGEYEIVKDLLESGGFSHRRTDGIGWTAKEYAVLNGHLAVADLFESSELGDMADGPARIPARKITYPKLRCAEGERIIIASLGTERLDTAVTEVALSYCSSAYTPETDEGLSYIMEVSAPGTTAQPRVVQLPILDDQINDPFVFPIPTAVEPQLVFKLIQLGGYDDDDDDHIVGSGTALLEGNKRQFGADRQSLIREQTIPIFDTKTMTVVGTVTFTFLVANHFPHLQTPRKVDLTRKAGEPPALIGHRGLGQNLKTHEYLQIGENTVESFVSAAKLGASFVEFDVQVTKDHEAVIFHDFSLSESGTDVPVHDLTLDQFMYASNIQSPHGNPLSVLGPVLSRDEPGRKRKRSRSVGGHFEAGAIQIRDRLKHTVDFRKKGFKPNTRGDFIQDSFATLKELLSQVPEHVAFDVEIKYPRLHEATTAGLAPVAIELNTFVDVALNAIHQHAGNRQIILSSFTPEICMLLSLKQKAYPVFFITNAGKVPMADMERRAASVKVGVRFAQRWNLAGVVFACEPILLCPRLVGYVKNRGLVCATYGTLNNVPENVKVRLSWGLKGAFMGTLLTSSSSDRFRLKPGWTSSLQIEWA
ncbi:GDPD-domain-containing protein [Coniochaeta ligniaria NRRL 30616]|uniref:GDPD-domain-containing protein n=1 Tax=Coniochaeta ligniaria NRRL 30616 TaxID=1408157 RepID=A0A1J7J8E9_9PEZI|nr:GDPD-domain-containing protein [Coniochaeta ligniaria NRRL 30616]